MFINPTTHPNPLTQPQYADIGGMDIQKQEMREAVELPLTHFELYQQIGIDPPRGVLMYGPPGCGKTMLAKAVAHHTTASFIRYVCMCVCFFCFVCLFDYFVCERSLISSGHIGDR